MQEPDLRLHNTTREGAELGLMVGLATWVWVALVDALAGSPFQTMRSLAGVAMFTAIHAALCLAYGIAIVAAVHAAMRTPSVVYAMVFCTILFQAAFIMLTVFLAELGAGTAAWSRFLVGNAIAAVLTFVMLASRHSLWDIFHRAEEEG